MKTIHPFQSTPSARASEWTQQASVGINTTSDEQRLISRLPSYLWPIINILQGCNRHAANELTTIFHSTVLNLLPIYHITVTEQSSSWFKLLASNCSYLVATVSSTYHWTVGKKSIYVNHFVLVCLEIFPWVWFFSSVSFPYLAKNLLCTFGSKWESKGGSSYLGYL